MKGVTATALAIVMEEARDHVWDSIADAPDPWSMSDGEIIAAVNRTYEGGWQQFLRDGE